MILDIDMIQDGAGTKPEPEIGTIRTMFPGTPRKSRNHWKCFAGIATETGTVFLS